MNIINKINENIRLWTSIIISIVICAIVIAMIEKTIQNIIIVIILGATVLWLYIFFILFLISCLAKSIKEKKRHSSVSLSLFIVYVLGFAPASILFFSSIDKREKAYQEKDYKTVVKEYQKATYLSYCYFPLLFAQEGLKYEDSSCYIADIFFFGKGVPRDEKKAAKLYRKAEKGEDSWPKIMVKAIDGDKTAQLEAGLRLAPRILVEDDYESAAIMFRMSAEQGVLEAQRILGCCYHWGEGVVKDDAEAAKWFHLASEQGDKLSEAFLNVLGGNPSMLLNSVSLDSSIASYDGSMGYSFLIHARMDKEFEKWYRELAEQGNPQAQTKLATWYYNGTFASFGLKRNETEAVKWYLEASKQIELDDEAAYHLGFCYYHGRGVEKDTDEGVKWLTIAAEKGNKDAIEALKTINN